MRGMVAWCGALLGLAGSAAGQQAPVVRSPDTVTVTPGPAYAKGGIYRFFFGAHYRDLWTTPIRVPVLDLSTFAGGLTPLRQGGGQQTKSLRLVGADGRQYQFRSVDKDPSAVLPPDLRNTFADRVFQDQISGGHPTGSLIVPPILEAAGVLHAPPVLVMMPDDARLGEFRATFANLLGTIEERPRDAEDDAISFAGATEVVGTEDLLDALEENASVRVDAREFLAARLIDVFLGDWDRHQDQWRWARMEDGRGERWRPIPRDRDQAFARFDGFLLRAVRRRVPQLVNFGPDYPSITGATWNGRDLDRRLLVPLERPAWDSVARALRDEITDAVIDDAVNRLPPEFLPIDGPRLRRALRARRDAVPEMAGDYYRLLVGQVDVVATDEDEDARVERVDGRFVDVTVAVRGRAPWFRRRFDARETRDLRVYLHGGNDRATVAGPAGGGPTVRFIGGGGGDVFRDSARGGSSHFYDDRGTNRATGGGIDTRAYQAIDDTTDPTALPHRDWGKSALSYPYASIGPDVGLQIGWGGNFTRYGFRKKPYSSRLRYLALFSTGAQTGKLSLSARRMWENSRNFWSIDLLASGLEVLNWYGFGNERGVDPAVPASFYRANQHQLRLAPSFGWAIGERGLLTVGPRFKYAVTELDDGATNAGRFIGLDQPFGTEGFAEVGLGAELEIDTRDLPAAARRGIHLRVSGRFYAEALDVTDPFGKLRGELSTYLTVRIPTSPTLALLAGGEALFGTSGRIPFHEAAFLGSGSTLRGYGTERFAGDQGSMFGTAELRLHLTDLFVLLPGEQGVFGFYDIGRVYDSGDPEDDPNTWHTSFGGGVWLSFVTRGSLVSVSVGHSEEGNRLHAGVGFAF